MEEGKEEKYERRRRRRRRRNMREEEQEEQEYIMEEEKNRNSRQFYKRVHFPIRHRSEKMSECPVCGKSFTRSDNLKRHIKMFMRK